MKNHDRRLPSNWGQEVERYERLAKKFYPDDLDDGEPFEVQTTHGDLTLVKPQGESALVVLESGLPALPAQSAIWLEGSGIGGEYTVGQGIGLNYLMNYRRIHVDYEEAQLRSHRVGSRLFDLNRRYGIRVGNSSGRDLIISVDPTTRWTPRVEQVYRFEGPDRIAVFQ